MRGRHSLFLRGRKNQGSSHRDARRNWPVRFRSPVRVFNARGRRKANAVRAQGNESGNA